MSMNSKAIIRKIRDSFFFQYERKDLLHQKGVKQSKCKKVESVTFARSFFRPSNKNASDFYSSFFFLSSRNITFYSYDDHSSHLFVL